MLEWFKARNALRDTAKQLYGTSVTQARQETFYAQRGVPDTVEGRFEMIVLHLFLVVRRLQRQGKQGQDLARAMLEAFVIDVDDHMREVGIADLKVPKHVKKAAAIAYERYGDYGAALDGPADGPVQKLIIKHIYGQDQDAEAPSADQIAGATAITDYMRACEADLAQQDGAELLAGKLFFPLPGQPEQAQ